MAQKPHMTNNPHAAAHAAAVRNAQAQDDALDLLHKRTAAKRQLEQPTATEQPDAEQLADASAAQAATVAAAVFDVGALAFVFPAHEKVREWGTVLDGGDRPRAGVVRGGRAGQGASWMDAPMTRFRVRSARDDNCAVL